MDLELLFYLFGLIQRVYDFMINQWPDAQICAQEGLLNLVGNQGQSGPQEVGYGGGGTTGGWLTR